MFTIIIVISSIIITDIKLLEAAFLWNDMYNSGQLAPAWEQ